MVSRSQFLESEVNALKKQQDDRFAEVEKMGKENEHFKSELTAILHQYDLEKYDDAIKSAKKTEEWSE